MAQLSPFNTVFQADLLAIQEACLRASKTNQQVWSDSESSFHSIDTKSPIVQQTQEILLKSTNILNLDGLGFMSDIAVMKRRTYKPRRQHRKESPHTSQRQETISRVCYKKSPSSAGKKNGTMEKQTGVFATFCLKSRQLLLHGKGQK
ncbi:hypothetical protein AVEN_42655-1 [Araneus ventricosus]|uniref:Uncharacterized protein n=1 Tax=Araneus ventricosus TaxID=182803 RepID=A0A4Y2BP38_ARAVE|nr:hypothetical protein AVEN_42655-1 [Araneus ventricosus]